MSPVAISPVWAVYTSANDNWWVRIVIWWDDDGTPFVWDDELNQIVPAAERRHFWSIVADVEKHGTFDKIVHAIANATEGEEA